MSGFVAFIVACSWDNLLLLLILLQLINMALSLDLVFTVPNLGLWRPLGNNIIEKTSTPWPNKFNDCKDMCGIIILQLTMSRNVAAT